MRGQRAAFLIHVKTKGKCLKEHTYFHFSQPTEATNTNFPHTRNLRAQYPHVYSRLSSLFVDISSQNLKMVSEGLTPPVCQGTLPTLIHPLKFYFLPQREEPHLRGRNICSQHDKSGIPAS